MLYCAYVECGSETPTCAYAHETRPEQSKPPGAPPPHTYGVPSCDIATPTTPPCVEGGATIVCSCGATAETPTTVSIACCCETRCCWAIRACAAAAICSWRACSAATIRAISPLIEESRLFCCGDLRLDRLLGCGARRDDVLLADLRLGEQLAVPLHGAPEDLDLTEDVRVERGDAARAVHPVDHVVEAAGAKDHLERRCLIRCVERHEPLCDPALARLSGSAWRSRARAGSASGRAGSSRAGGGRRVLRPRALEIIREPAQLTHHLLGLGPLRRHRGVGKCRHCRRQGDADHRKYVWRLSQATNE